VWVDSGNKATLRTKNIGLNKNKDENVVDGYRQGDIIYIKFSNGDLIKFYYKKNELVRISADKSIVAHVYPDNSKVIDDKSKKTKELNNKYGIKTTFNVENNKYSEMDVKYHFKYGHDVVYYMMDGTVITKKEDGTMLLLDNNNDKTILDEDGHVKYKDSYRFKLHYNMTNQNKKPLITDINSKGIKLPF